MPTSAPALGTCSPIRTALGCLGLSIAACSAHSPTSSHAAHTSARTNPPVQSASPDNAQGQPAVWRLLQELPSLHRATSRGRSQHLTGELESESLINDLGAPYPDLSPTQHLPAGAVLVAPHYEPGSDRPVVFFAMIKQQPGFNPASDDWEFLIVRPNGDIEQRGKLTLCGRCHAEAPHDSLFGRPD